MIKHVSFVDYYGLAQKGYLGSEKLTKKKAGHKSWVDKSGVTKWHYFLVWALRPELHNPVKTKSEYPSGAKLCFFKGMQIIPLTFLQLVILNSFSFFKNIFINQYYKMSIKVDHSDTNCLECFLCADDHRMD